MADQFQSLYRRYRPQRFSEVRGQSHVVLGLRNAAREDRVSHAYLFSGPRGTGKTSTARILAKALNCADPHDGEPCGVCGSCVEITRGASLDVHELDAASNNGVDAMRDLVARASLATPGKWKVYIVDEVHMLSTAASNALLKTLEEPPDHVVFVLATTDPQKVLPTIKSRTQHFEFHLMEPEVLAGLLADVAKDANLAVPDEGIESAVRRGHGSARDALSALDQVAAAGVVEEDDRWVRDLLRAMVEQDSALALRTVAEAMAAGFDANRLASELVDGLRDVFLGVVAPDSARLSSWASAAGADGPPALGPARCVRALELVGTAIVDMREALDARTTFEVALVRLTHPDVDDSPAAVLERLERLERRLQELAAGRAVASSAPAAAPRPAPPTSAVRAESPQAASGPLEPPPAGPSRGPGPSSPALGAYLPKPAAAPASAAAAPAIEPSAAEPVAATPPASPAPSTSPATPSPAPAQSTIGVGTPAPTSVAVPSRDDLVTAWGDHVLHKLRPRARAVYAVGRFVAVEQGDAVFALPNAAHVEHADPLVKEVAEALSSHFSTTIGLRLVTETDLGSPNADPPDPSAPEGRPAGEASPASPDVEPAPSRQAARAAAAKAAAAPPSTAAPAAAQLEDPDGEDVDLDDLEPGSEAGHHDSRSWAENRLLEEFPGAEEVT
ncbi:MAG: DNA polymerase III subunit gamma/tau [Acidimicrobiales bacterium]